MEVAGALDLRHDSRVAIVSLVLAVIVLVLIGVGIAVGLVACALAALLVGLGVLSSSVVVGMLSGRATDGIRVFLLQCGVIAGVPAGAICALLATSLQGKGFFAGTAALNQGPVDVEQHESNHSGREQ